MRIQNVVTAGLAMFASISLVACGGDDGGSAGDDGGDDAPMDMAPSCDVVMSMYNASEAGNEAMPITGNFFETIPSGQLAGRKFFNLGLVLPGSTQSAQDQITIQVLKPADMGAVDGEFPLNMAIPFNSMVGGAVALSLIAGDVTANGDATHLYNATNGSITLTAISEEDGGTISGSVTATNFAQVNQDTLEPITNGCTTATAAFTFRLTQMAGAKQAPISFAAPTAFENVAP